MKQHSYFIAETAFHHQGEFEYLIALIDASKKAGFDAIKFQVLINPDEFLSKNHSQYQTLSGYCFSEEQWLKVLEYSRYQNLDIIILPLDTSAIELTKNKPIKFFDIHSVSFNDKRILTGLKNSSIPILLSIGGRTLEEIENLIEYFGNKIEVLMYGFQAFPSKVSEVKLEKIQLLKERFTNIPIGYADHSSYDDDYRFLSNYYARYLGASYFEKHITLSIDKNRVDHNSAMDAGELNRLIEKMKFIDKTLSSVGNDYSLSDSEQNYRDRQLRVVAISNIKRGDYLSNDNIGLRMIEEKEGLAKMDSITGKVCRLDIPIGTVISSSHLN